METSFGQTSWGSHHNVEASQSHQLPPPTKGFHHSMPPQQLSNSHIGLSVSPRPHNHVSFPQHQTHNYESHHQNHVPPTDNSQNFPPPHIQAYNSHFPHPYQSPKHVQPPHQSLNHMLPPPQMQHQNVQQNLHQSPVLTSDPTQTHVPPPQQMHHQMAYDQSHHVASVQMQNHITMPHQRPPPDPLHNHFTATHSRNHMPLPQVQNQFYPQHQVQNQMPPPHQLQNQFHPSHQGQNPMPPPHQLENHMPPPAQNHVLPQHPLSTHMPPPQSHNMPPPSQTDTTLPPPLPPISTPPPSHEVAVPPLQFRNMTTPPPTLLNPRIPSSNFAVPPPSKMNRKISSPFPKFDCSTPPPTFQNHRGQRPFQAHNRSAFQDSHRGFYSNKRFTGDNNRGSYSFRDEGKKPYACDTCDKAWYSKARLDEHLAEHETCGVDNCKFTAHPKIVAKHIEMQHFTGLIKRIGKVETPEEIEKWRAERRKKFPTREAIEKKKAELAEKIQRGELLPKTDRNRRPSTTGGWRGGRGDRGGMGRGDRGWRGGGGRGRGWNRENGINQDGAGGTGRGRGDRGRGRGRFDSDRRPEGNWNKDQSESRSSFYNRRDENRTPRENGQERTPRELINYLPYEEPITDSCHCGLAAFKGAGDLSSEDTRLPYDFLFMDLPEGMETTETVESSDTEGKKEAIVSNGHDDGSKDDEKSEHEERRNEDESIAEGGGKEDSVEDEGKTPKETEDTNTERECQEEGEVDEESGDESQQDEKKDDEKDANNEGRKSRKRVRRKKVKEGNSQGESKETSPPPAKVKRTMPRYIVNRRRKHILLENLLRNDIRHERNVLFQCVRYIVSNNFFNIPCEKKVDCRYPCCAESRAPVAWAKRPPEAVQNA